jgi:hypothetical protein
MHAHKKMCVGVKGSTHALAVVTGRKVDASRVKSLVRASVGLHS